MRNRIAAAVFGLALALPSFAFASGWDIDNAHSSATFSIRHLAISNVRGEFTKVSGTIQLDDKDITRSSVSASIDAGTVSTREEKRDGHLKSPDFFDVAKYPNITFQSTSVSKAANGHLMVVGNLTLHGITKPETLDVQNNGTAKDPYGNTKAGFTATTTINRKDFDVGPKFAPAVLGTDVAITIDIEAQAQKPGGAAK